MATQDIAVDGMALVILPSEYVGYAKICNNIGQSIGSYITMNGLLSFTDLK